MELRVRVTKLRVTELRVTELRVRVTFTVIELVFECRGRGGGSTATVVTWRAPLCDWSKAHGCSDHRGRQDSCTDCMSRSRLSGNVHTADRGTPSGPMRVLLWPDCALPLTGWKNCSQMG